MCEREQEKTNFRFEIIYKNWLDTPGCTMCHFQKQNTYKRVYLSKFVANYTAGLVSTLTFCGQSLETKKILRLFHIRMNKENTIDLINKCQTNTRFY